MSRRAILALSAALSAFVLVLAGAAATYLWRSPPEASTKPSAGNFPAAPDREPRAESTRFERREDDDEHERHGKHERKHRHHEDDDG